MRITFLCQYFPPEMGAPSARTFEHARHWAALGHDVSATNMRRILLRRGLLQTTGLQRVAKRVENLIAEPLAITPAQFHLQTLVIRVAGLVIDHDVAICETGEVLVRRLALISAADGPNYPAAMTAQTYKPGIICVMYATSH